MRDGTILRADIYRPDTGTNHPVMLMRLPYDKSFVDDPNFPAEPRYFVPRGYICVVQDVRGTFTSDGTFYPLRDEGADTVDTIEWAASIEGSNGKVVMTGQSYLGSVQVQGAAERPAALVAVSPISPCLDIAENGFRRGGAVESAFLFAWATGMAIDTARRAGRDDEVKRLAALIEDQPHNPFPPLTRSNALHAPFDEVLQNFDEVAPWVREMLLDTQDPDGGQYVSTRHLVPNITVPSLYVTSWYDMFLGGVLNAYAVGVAAGAAATHLVIGPWAHAHYGIPQSVAGELDFGPAAEMELWPMLERFFAPTVGLGPAGTMAGVQYFTMGIDEWRSADVWPPEATSVEFFIHSEGGPAATGVTGALDMVAPADEPADEWVHDPLVPVPSTGGQTWGVPNGPMDQSLLVERTDVLAYDSEGLIADVEVTGAVHADLWIETDAVSADIVAALVDVHPNGRRYLVTQGILRRGSKSSPLYDEWSTNFKVDLWATSHVFLPGHRISLHIAASDFPHWDVNLSDGNPWPTSSEPRAVNCRIAHDAACPSMVVLPIIGELPSRSGIPA